jgi:methylthioribulose-1-phosphate dehydratase|tara:strand:+ start:27099 stop:27710 length:612 start_codon:yes stop_codon:yes gene_type:complete
VKEQLKKDLAKVIRNINRKGWSPATSTNYSFRESSDSKNIVVSRSGVDKAFFTKNDYIEVDMDGLPLPKFKDQRPSAETLIHCTLYKLFPETKVILHSHSVYPVLWSKKLNKEITFQGYEVQKGFAGQTSHLSEVSIPIIENSQDMVEFSEGMELRKDEFDSHCFLIKGHGTYAWGKNLFEAKRHLETIDYLCELEWKLQNSK